ncbi:G-type lectin S-receptor-like serine/threonine-protein kinase At2g19130 isoform X1 [Cynara cardunculus var. scolymus]|uniref:Receptor-like serine/threonine-protein kinase n=1 Tax=Cynara cardunculus var. scolymus TaxID=59895 RepID=A0A103Y7Z6_CYNCS|nr:G-type lectin S-receptor-like serine/threonine-protein kinase At2g19130 isoform X1 [Cynara cardunculus var. scolymus]XP_024989528.1 G-type lectin S-receptor-like serine/threonine-protein kinase At2g19130 isoform X1 [Cynara cardunculus var. scolymus]KVI04165.1 Apple-like protein [Cynara cardunculus var. scolymus]
MFFNSSVMGFLLLLCSSLIVSLSSGADTITANESISGDQTLISKDGKFELGFFKAGNSSNYYIGMWYKKVNTILPTVAWVANRETPVSNRFESELKIIDGNLVLLNESKSPIWSTGLNSSSSNSVVAVLLDDGNLVLRDGPNSTGHIWQSFDFPGNTWLPGAKMSYNNITGKKQLLTSWKSLEDPSEGLFSLELDPKGKQYIIRWNRSTPYWTSGTWNGHIFSLVPEMRANYIYNFSYVENQNESYFTYSLYDNETISRFIMDISGQIKQLTWLEPSQQWNLFWSQPREQCEVYDYCGAFGSCRQSGLPFCNCLTGFNPRSPSNWSLTDFSGGCVRKTELQCGRTSEKYGFLPISATATADRKPPNFTVLAVGSSGECQRTCLNNCSCNAYSYDNNGCSIWNGELLNLSDDNDNATTIYVKVASKDLPSQKKNNGVIIGAVVGSVVGLVLILGLILFLIHRNKRSVGKTAVEGSLISFVYRDLQTATKNFSDKLGGGGFGSVFKGTLPDSTVVAVKKLESVTQGEKQFRSEVSTIGTIHHVNLVRLRGFCSEGNSKLLVYDYMPNGSLDSHLFSNEKLLDWKTRYQIALGIARGLVYLHEKCRDCIIHCDIKPENILLDTDLCPKIADFGLSKLVGRDFSRVLTTMRGTRGYLAPEWLSGVAITMKADVYSYGMMLFEFISGTRNSEQSEDGKKRFFPMRAANVLIDGDDILTLVDPRLNGNASAEEVTKLCKVACWCIQDDEEARPAMSQVEQILEGLLDVNMPPKPRALQLFVDDDDHVVFFTESSSSQSSQARSNPSSGVSQAKSTAST